MSVQCPLCASTSLVRLEEEPPYAVYACRDCEYGFVHPTPSREALAQAYDAAYYEPWTKQQAAARKRLWQRRLARVRAYVQTGRLLDVGGGDGGFAEAAKRVGFAVEATELSEAGAREIAARAGVPVHVGEVEELALPQGGYDVITAWHVLEHMRRPFAALAAMQRLLAPGGWLFIAVPNRRNLLMRALYRLAKRRPYPLFSMKAREIHLSHFTPASLVRAIQQAGFRVVAMDWDDALLAPHLRALDWMAALVHRLGGPLITEAMLAVARKD